MSQYTPYEKVDQAALQKEIEAIRKTIKVTEEDFLHLLKLERWGRAATLSGFAMIALAVILHSLHVMTPNVAFWSLGVFGAFLIGVGNVARWSNVTHPILHGAYDKVPNIPARYTKNGYAICNPIR